jgi:hypothetical protein
VHASRIIHVAEKGLQDSIIGTPRLRKVWNRLDDLDKFLGGSGEMYWQDAKRRIVAALHDDASMSEDELAKLDDRIEEFIHELRNVLKVQGMDVTLLAGSIADPSNAIDKQIEIIAGALGVPKRKLVGSERGELASSQDENNMAALTMSRQQHFAEPTILRPFIDRLIQYQGLVRPVKGYSVAWPNLLSLSEKEQSEVALNYARAFQAYGGTLTPPEQILPVEVFLNDIIGFDKEQVQRIMDLLGQLPLGEGL